MSIMTDIATRNLMRQQLAMLDRVAGALERIAEALYTTRSRKDEAGLATVLDSLDDRVSVLADEVSGLKRESPPRDSIR